MNGRRIGRVLVFSHAAVLDVNRAIFQELARVAGVELALVVPRRWKGDLIKGLSYAPSAGDKGIRVIALPALWSGNGSLFLYPLLRHRLLGPGGPLQGWEPDWVFVDEEPWSLCAQQIYAAFPDRRRCFFTKQNLKKNNPWVFRQLEDRVFRQSSHAYAVAEEVADVLRAKGYHGSIRQLWHSYDPALFRPASPVANRETRARLGIPPDAIVLGYFGRLVEEKGIAELQAAMAEVVKVPALGRAHFLWVGNGPMFDALKAALPPGRATLIPAIPHDDVGKVLACIDVLVLPSRTTTFWKEQFGRILVEAMACGAAVIGSDSGEIPHLIQRSGGGRVFREGSTAALLEQITALLTRPELLADLREKGRRYVEENLTHTAVARYLASDLGLLPPPSVEAVSRAS